MEKPLGKNLSVVTPELAAVGKKSPCIGMWWAGSGQGLLLEQLSEKLLPADWIVTTAFSRPVLTVNFATFSEVIRAFSLRSWVVEFQCGENLDPEREQGRTVLRPWLLHACGTSTQEGWAANADTCERTPRTSLCKCLENLELVLQPAVLFEWYDYLSVSQLAASAYPTVLRGSTAICIDCIHHWAAASLWEAPDSHFSCHRSHQKLHLPDCSCFRQLCLQEQVWGRCSCGYLAQREKNQHDIFTYVFSCLHLLPSSRIVGICIYLL